MTPANALLAVGYPVAVAMIVRWVPIVRQRRLGQFALHQAGVGAIVAGWALRGRTQGVVVNGSWWVSAALWYTLAGRRRAG
ncbi:MAG: hypothetical protein M3R01_01680 [Actinomycetota bacterium]|nr:hypothetical protein [Actinomycetota bacterium]